MKELKEDIMHKMLKEEIMHTILINGNNIDELVNVLQWALKKAEALQDMQNECELNALENSSYEE